MFYTGNVTHAETQEPLVGITVSDGRNITKTDCNGYYELPGWERSNVLNISLLTAGHDDWFKYTGNKSGEYNFRVTPVDVDSSAFHFFHTSDSEIESWPKNPWVDYFAQKVKEYHPTFLMHTGDICNKDGLCRHYTVMSNEKMGCPVRYSIGNHDYAEGSYGEQLYEIIYGPTWYSFDCGDVHFVALSYGRGDFPSGYQVTDQFKWLHNDLQMMDKNKKLIVFDHEPCSDPDAAVHEIHGEKFDFSNQGLIAWVCGHNHMNFDIETKGIRFMESTSANFGGGNAAISMRKINLNGYMVSSDVMYYNPVDVEPCDKHIWRTKLKGRLGFCPHVLYEDDIFAATMEEGSPKECGVYRLCGETGEVRWFYRTREEIKNAFAIDNGKLYVQDCSAMLYCIDVQSGELIWKTESKIDKPSHTDMAVAVMGDVVFGGKQKQLYGYDKNTGEQIWYRENKKGAGGGTPARFVVDEKHNTLIANPQWYKLQAIDPKTGEIKWENGERVLWFRTNTPVLDGDVLYTAGDYEYAAVDVTSGNILCRIRKDFLMDVSGAAAVDGDVLYIPTSTTGVVAFDKHTLETLRFFPTGPATLFTAPYVRGDVQMVEGSPIVKGNQLIFAASDGKVWVYDKNTAELIKTINIGAPSIVSPIVTDENIYVADFDGYITKFQHK